MTTAACHEWALGTYDTSGHPVDHIDKETLVDLDVSGDPYSDVLAELHGLRQGTDSIEGSVVATTDGMVIAHDLSATQTFSVEPEGVAALSAVHLGLSQRITDTASHGELQEVIVRGSFGQVVTYAAGERALLAVLLRVTTDVPTLHRDARSAADRIAARLAHAWRDDAATWRAP